MGYKNSHPVSQGSPYDRVEEKVRGMWIDTFYKSLVRGEEVYLFGMMVSNLAHEPTIFRAMAWDDLFSMRFAITHYRVY